MNGILQWIDGLKNTLTIIGFSIAGLCVVIFAIMLLFGGSQGGQKGKSWGLSIVAAIFVLTFGPSIIAVLKG